MRWVVASVAGRLRKAIIEEDVRKRDAHIERSLKATRGQPTLWNRAALRSVNLLAPEVGVPLVPRGSRDH